MSLSKPIFWTIEAENSFLAIVRYLNQNWSNRQVSAFITSAERTISLIQQHPEMFRKTNIAQVHEALISKHQILIYRNQNHRIDLLVFWDTRRDPSNKPG